MTWKNKLQAAIVVLCVQAIPFHSEAIASDYSFERYKVESIYKAMPVYPDFKNRDRKFATYRTRITNGIKDGVNFGGQYSFIQFGCGTGCSLALLSDLKTGRVYEFPRGGEDNQFLNLKFIPSSTLVVARWFSETERCFVEQLVWKNEKFDAISKKDVGGREECLEDFN